MHDRRIDGTTYTFGNAGGLYMNAMTWYDHETRSIWSQPWGRAIAGDLLGVQLNLLPSQLTTWKSWRESHPGTLAMVNNLDQLGNRRQGFQPDFVIGLILGNRSKAYRYDDTREEGVINDTLGDTPVVVITDGDEYFAYVRRVGDQELVFRKTAQGLVDEQSGSTWDMTRGLALDGKYAGDGLQPVPSLSSFDWAWFDFYPDSEIYTP